ncbi:serine hydrolase FSH [Xylaria sp. FL0064]|nr:serine hydrolase FSH [Xylaria sp. FL0064]
MHFLCMHGAGSNSETFETQTAALRYELGDNHTYDFVEGVIPSSMAPELEGVASPNGNYFNYINETKVDSCVSALRDLDAYVAEEGPFDGILAFSQGAMVAATYSVWKYRQSRVGAAALSGFPFKCAIFLSAWGAVDPHSLATEGRVRDWLVEVEMERLPIPTAHIWGGNDISKHNAQRVSDIFSTSMREIYEHNGSHEVPGPRMVPDVKASVRMVRRVIARASRNTFPQRF